MLHPNTQDTAHEQSCSGGCRGKGTVMLKPESYPRTELMATRSAAP
jgi:hypothetical protein